jgi:hypothetical protein
MSKLTVSEPWDFVGPNGGNELPGIILKRLDQKTLLFKTDNEVTLKGSTSRYWLLSSRYENQFFNEEPYQGTVNGALLPSLPSEYDSLSKLRQSSVFAVIGSLQD